jgi:hypothetical protein
MFLRDIRVGPEPNDVLRSGDVYLSLLDELDFLETIQRIERGIPEGPHRTRAPR